MRYCRKAQRYCNSVFLCWTHERTSVRVVHFGPPQLQQRQNETCLCMFGLGLPSRLLLVCTVRLVLEPFAMHTQLARNVHLAVADVSFVALLLATLDWRKKTCFAFILQLDVSSVFRHQRFLKSSEFFVLAQCCFFPPSIERSH